VGGELAPAHNISLGANCGELLRVWQCSDHPCVMIDPLIFDDKIEGYGRLLATLCARLFAELLKDAGGEVDAMYAAVIHHLRAVNGQELTDMCPATKLETVTRREELPLPPCATRNPSSYEIVRACLYDSFDAPKIEFSVIPQRSVEEVASLLVNVTSEVATTIARGASFVESLKYKLLRCFHGKRSTMHSFIGQLLIERMTEYLDSFRETTQARVGERLQQDMDAQHLAELQKVGCPLDHLHEIEHVFVCDAGALRALAAELKGIGLNVDESREDGTLLACKEMRSPKSMPERAQQLRKVAARFKAQYDGWGSCCPLSESRQ